MNPWLSPWVWIGGSIVAYAVVAGVVLLVMRAGARADIERARSMRARWAQGEPWDAL